MSTGELTTGAPVRLPEPTTGLLAQLGTRSALSWRVMAIYCPFGIAIQVPGNASIYGGGVATWILASATGMAVLCAVLAGARAISCRKGEPRPVAVLTSYATAAIAQSMTLGFMSVLIGLADDPQIGFRLSGLIWHLPLLATTGYLVASHESHRRVIANLERRRARLLTVGRASDAELERLEADLSGAVRASLDPALEVLDATLAQAAAGTEPLRALAALDDLVDNRVRPLSRELMSHPEPSEVAEMEEPASRPRVPLPKDFPLGDGIRTGLITLTMLVVSIPTAAREFGSTADLLAYLSAFAALTWSAITAARRAAGAVRVRTGFGVAAVILIVVALGSAVFWLIGKLGIPRPTGIHVSLPVAFALVATMSVASMLIRKQWLASETQLDGVTLQLELAVRKLRRRELLVRRRLAFILHGALQGALHSTALRIRESKAISEETVSDIQRDIAAALGQIGSPRSSAGTLRTRGTLGDLAAVWDGPRKVTARVEPSVEQALASDVDADEAAAEVVREAVNNAFRHGAADTIEIHLSAEPGLGRDEPGSILITVTDNGMGPAEGAAPGLGSSLFDELCSSWGFSRGERGTTLWAMVGLS